MSLLWVAPLAILVGLSLGALGGGGAILTVPILVHLLHQPPAAAVTGALVIVGITSLAGITSHWRSGHVLLREGLIFGASGVGGSLIGSRLSLLAPPDLLMAIFGALTLAVAAIMVRPQAQKSPEPAPAPRRGLGVLLVTATGVGLLTGFFGVGGGFAAVPALVLALGFTMPAAVATSLVVIVINSATALAVRVGTGLAIDWIVIGTFSALGALGSVVGARLARRLNPRVLKLAFSILLLTVGIYVLTQSVPLLWA